MQLLDVVGFSQSDDVGDEGIQIGFGDDVFVEAGHGAEAGADLGFHEAAGSGFVVERGTEAGAAVGMTLMAALLEDDLTRALFVVEFHGADDRFAAADRMAAEACAEKQKYCGGFFHSLVRVIFQMTPVSICGLAPSFS